MRTIEEIAAYYARQDDLFGFTGDVLLRYLPYDAVQPWLEEGVTPAEWAEAQRPLTRETVIADMRDYMEFAWQKAGGHRGISAHRSIAKLRAWLWLLGDEATIAVLDEGRHFRNYGAPMLKRICAVYGFPLPTDPGVLRMAEGLPCREGCREGCGQ